MDTIEKVGDAEFAPVIIKPEGRPYCWSGKSVMTMTKFDLEDLYQFCMDGASEMGIESALAGGVGQVVGTDIDPAAIAIARSAPTATPADKPMPPRTCVTTRVARVRRWTWSTAFSLTRESMPPRQGYAAPSPRLGGARSPGRPS